MISLIIKNIWHRRAANIWLFVELIVVTVVTWVIIDPVVVRLSDRMLPLGYDEDRLFYIQLASQPAESPAYSKDDDNDETRENNIESVVLKLKALDDIESVGVKSMPLNSVFVIETYDCGDAEIDSLKKNIYHNVFRIKDKMLSTIGAEAAEGCPSVEELERMSFGYNDVILTESADRYYFPDHRGVNEKYLTKKNISGHVLKLKVVGVLKDFRLTSTSRNTAYVFQNSFSPFDIPALIIVRLKDGIDTEEYINENRESLQTLATAGNYYVSDIYSVAESNREYEAAQGFTANRNLRISLAVLFLFNLILGVIGTVWLQTRRRISEIGIHRSFGALRYNVRTMLVGENVILAICAIVIGLLIYLQYALKEGLFDSEANADRYITNYSWVSDFTPHFVIVSAIVAAIILICIIIGSYLPARRASIVEPVDALRDE